jgi:hypothetical protein
LLEQSLFGIGSQGLIELLKDGFINVVSGDRLKLS